MIFAAVVYALATVSLCITGGECERNQIQIDRHACNKSYKAQVPINGEWKPATVSVGCGK